MSRSYGEEAIRICLSQRPSSGMYMGIRYIDTHGIKCGCNNYACNYFEYRYHDYLGDMYELTACVTVCLSVMDLEAWQQTHNVETIWIYRWPSVIYGGPALNQHVFSLLGYFCHPTKNHKIDLILTFILFPLEKFRFNLYFSGGNDNK